MKKINLIFFLLSIVFNASAGDQETSQLNQINKKVNLCKSCHGSNIGNRDYNYIIKSLESFRNGSRDNPAMNAIAKPLTDDEIKSLAKYYSQKN